MRSKGGAFLLMLLLFVFLATIRSYACTTFAFKHGNDIYFGENFDWHVSDGLVIVNKRDVKKTALVLGAGNQEVASWISKYGSLTFNLLGREYFHGGINSQGLFVSGLMLEQSRFPSMDSRPAISQAQWRQYLLDNCATVKEALAVQSQIRIYSRNSQYPVHFFIGDKDGQCATIEFIEGKMICHTGDSMPVNVLTNSTYAHSIAYLKEHEGFGGDRVVSSTRRNSFDRFVRAASMLQSYNTKTSAPPIPYGFKVLTSVAQGDFTVWRMMYDVSNMRIYFRTSFNYQMQYIDLKSFDFSCETPIRILDLNNTVSGDVASSFTNYTPDANRDLVTRANRFYKLPIDIVDKLIRYQNSLSCARE